MAPESCCFDPCGQFVFGVGLQRHIREKARIRIAAGDAAERMFAAVHHIGTAHDRPFRFGGGPQIIVVTTLPAFGKTVHADFFETRIGQQIRTLREFHRPRIVFFGEQGERFFQPLVLQVGRVGTKTLHERLNVLAGFKFRELHECRKPGG